MPRSLLYRFSHALPLSLIAFSLLTARAQVRGIDGPDLNWYGFPLFWHRWSGISSLERSVDLAAMLLDWGVYLVLGLAFCCLAPMARWLEAKPRRGLRVGLWALALVCAAGWADLFLPGVYLTQMPVPKAHEVLEYRLHLGWEFPY